jgi:hypothetical protein
VAFQFEKLAAPPPDKSLFLLASLINEALQITKLYSLSASDEWSIVFALIEVELSV